MSWFKVFEVFGWLCIALGTWSTAKAIRTLQGLIRIGKNEVVEPDLRRDAWRNVLLAPLTVIWGVFFVFSERLHDTLIWLPLAYVAMLVIWEVGSWFRRRNKVRSA